MNYQGPLSLVDLDVDAVTEVVMHHEWMPGHNFSPTTAHIAHQYDASCAVCSGDVRRVLEVALAAPGLPTNKGEA